MMTVHHGAVAGTAAAKAMAAYLTETQLSPGARETAEYYGRTEGEAAVAADGMGCAPTPRADMDPDLAAALALDGKLLTAEAFTNILAGRRADGEPLRDERAYEDETGANKSERHHLAYLDLTLSSGKDVSIAWFAAETEAERNSILEATRTAREETLRYVEEQVAWARVGDGGKEGAERGRMAWFSCQHYSARPTTDIARHDPETGEIYTERVSIPITGDPLLHSHNIVPNVLITADGRLASLDTRQFHGRLLEFGAVHDAILAREMHKLGIAAELDPETNKLALPAIPREVRAAFSKRSHDGEEAAREVAARVGKDWNALTGKERSNLVKFGTRSTREDKESNVPDMDAWREQARRMGWEHKSAVAYGPAAPERTRAAYMAEADTAGLPHLAEMLGKRAVIGQGDVRLAAARGFIAAGGLDSTADLGLVMRYWSKAGVEQHGQWTKLLWGYGDQGRIKLTTEMHRADESALIALARDAAAASTHALTPAQITVAVDRSGLAFEGEHGRAQRGAIETLGTDGDLSVLIGTAGAGKTTLLAPLVAAWQAQGREVWGTALSNRQATALEDTGIQRIHTRAVQPLLDSLNDGRAALTANTVLVLDELSQIGSRQMLQILRHRERIGFKLVALGDSKQNQSIEAGPVIDLLRRALGEDRIPEINTTVRQHAAREREIATMFREGRARDAIAAKREDGTAEMVPGGYRDAVNRVAALYAERRQATAERDGYCITISAPTNHDAREIGRAVREQRRSMGEVGLDRVTVAATDGQGAGYSLPLAEGDTVRLYARTRAAFADERGRRRSAVIGDNGSVLDVVSVDPERGLVLRGRSGKAGFVSWDALRDRAGTERVMLAYGDCLTISSSQGITSDEHINALPAGSQAVNGFSGYVAESRHRVRSWLVSSQGAELREVMDRRPSGLAPLVPKEAADASWANIARNLERQPIKESALVFLERAVFAKRQTVRAFQEVLRRHETREANGEQATMLREQRAVRTLHELLPRTAAALDKVAEQQAVVRESLRAMAAYYADKEGRRVDAAARMVDEGTLLYSDAVDRIVGAEMQDMLRGQKRDIHGLPERPAGMPDGEMIEARVMSRLAAALDIRQGRIAPEIAAAATIAGQAQVAAVQGQRRSRGMRA